MQHQLESVICTIVWHELLFGMHCLPAGARKTFLADYLTNEVRIAFDRLPYDEAAAEWHAEERGRLQRVGKTAPFADGQIASIAAVNNLTLVTLNRADFANFKGLRIKSW